MEDEMFDDLEALMNGDAQPEPACEMHAIEALADGVPALELAELASSMPEERFEEAARMLLEAYGEARAPKIKRHGGASGIYPGLEKLRSQSIGMASPFLIADEHKAWRRSVLNGADSISRGPAFFS